jgi:hypothetical protein
MLKQIQNTEHENFESEVEQNFTVILPGGSLKQLVDQGADINVTFENRKNYIELATDALLHVADE